VCTLEVILLRKAAQMREREEGSLLPKLIKGDTTLYIYDTHMVCIAECYL